MHFHNNKSKFSKGWSHCLPLHLWLIPLLLFWVVWGSSSRFCCSCRVWSGVVLVAVLMLLWGVWWCLFSFVICFVLFFPPFYHSVFMFFWVCVWCLSQLPSSALSPYSTPPTPSPANGPPSPKFGRDPLSYCLKEINKTVKPRISSFRTLKKTVSVMGQGTGNRVLLLLLHGFLRHSAANESIDWSGSSIMCNGMCMGGHNKVEITPLSHTMIFNHKNINFSPYFC